MTQDEIGDTRQRRRLSEQERWCNLAGAIINSQAEEPFRYDGESQAVEVSLAMMQQVLGVDRDRLISHINERKEKDIFTYKTMGQVLGYRISSFKRVWRTHSSAEAMASEQTKYFKAVDVLAFCEVFEKTPAGESRNFSLQELRKRAIMSIGGDRD